MLPPGAPSKAHEARIGSWQTIAVLLQSNLSQRVLRKQICPSEKSHDVPAKPTQYLLAELALVAGSGQAMAVAPSHSTPAKYRPGASGSTTPRSIRKAETPTWVRIAAWQRCYEGNLTCQGSLARGAPVTEGCRSTIINLVSDRDDSPVTQQPLAAVGRPDVYCWLNVACHARLPE
jgi:hypothetical protein